jgi:hypothetical protein
MALQTAAGIYTNAISNQAVSATQWLSIPVIAWYALKGLEQVGQARSAAWPDSVGHRFHRTTSGGR